jgi:hypothetical protein
MSQQRSIEQVVANLTLSELGRIERLVVTQDVELGPVLVEMFCRLRRGPDDVVVKIGLVDARGELPRLQPWLGFSEVFVEDLSADQLEGVRYRLHEESGALDVFCRLMTVSAWRGELKDEARGTDIHPRVWLRDHTVAR